MASPLQIKVSCYAGYRGEETPRYLELGARRLAVRAILDRWLAPSHRYFKLETEDGARYIIRHDVPTAKWEIVYYSCALKE